VASALFSFYKSVKAAMPLSNYRSNRYFCFDPEKTSYGSGNGKRIAYDIAFGDSAGGIDGGGFDRPFYIQRTQAHIAYYCGDACQPYRARIF